MYTKYHRGQVSWSEEKKKNQKNDSVVTCMVGSEGKRMRCWNMRLSCRFWSSKSCTLFWSFMHSSLNVCPEKPVKRKINASVTQTADCSVDSRYTPLWVYLQYRAGKEDSQIGFLQPYILLTAQGHSGHKKQKANFMMDSLSGLKTQLAHSVWWLHVLSQCPRKRERRR